MSNRFGADVADFSILESHVTPRERAQDAVSNITERHDGFSAFVSRPCTRGRPMEYPS